MQTKKKKIANLRTHRFLGGRVITYDYPTIIASLEGKFDSFSVAHDTDDGMEMFL